MRCIYILFLLLLIDTLMYVFINSSILILLLPKEQNISPFQYCENPQWFNSYDQLRQTLHGQSKRYLSYFPHFLLIKALQTSQPSRMAAQHNHIYFFPCLLNYYQFARRVGIALLRTFIPVLPREKSIARCSIRMSEPERCTHLVLSMHKKGISCTPRNAYDPQLHKTSVSLKHSNTNKILKSIHDPHPLRLPYPTPYCSCLNTITSSATTTVCTALENKGLVCLCFHATLANSCWFSAEAQNELQG